MNKQQILTGTEQMKGYLMKIDQIYENARETGAESDFFTVVKPFVDEVHHFTNEWCDQVEQWIKLKSPKNLYMPQIEAAKENMKEICVQAFYPKTSYSRFKHSVHSINYTVEKILTEIKK